MSTAICQECGDRYEHGSGGSICDLCSREICSGCTYTCIECGLTICPACKEVNEEGEDICFTCFTESME